MYEPSAADLAALDSLVTELGLSDLDDLVDDGITEAKGGNVQTLIKTFGSKWAKGPHPHAACVAALSGKVSDPNALCAWLKDRKLGTTKWRGKEGMEKITESIEIRREVEGTAGREWDILIIKPGVSKNGVWYEPSVLKAAAPLYEGAVSYDRHGDGSARSFKERIGRLHTVTYETREGDEGLWGRLRVIDPSVREKLLEAVEAGELHTVGFSHDVMATQEQSEYQGRRVRKARKIESVNSVDMVERPSAGGRMSRLVAGEVDGMERDEIQTLVAESVKEAMQAANADLVKAFREAQTGNRTQEQPTEITATTIQTGGDAGFSLLEEVRKANEEAATALREAKKERQRNLLTSLLDATKITEVSKTFLRARFEEAIARRELDDTEIKTMVDQTVEHEAVIMQGRSDPNVPGGSRFSVTGPERDRIIKRLDAMFMSPQEKPEDGIRPFSSFKEAYVTFTGKWNASVYEMMEDYLPSKGYISSRDHDHIQESIATSSWGQIFADAMYRNMIKAYTAAPWYDAWRLIVSTIENVPDFRTRHWMRIGGYGDLPVVSEGATYPQATSPTDEEETYSLSKRGYIDDITMEAIINDDVGVVSRILREMGRAAARTLYRFVMDLATTSNPTLGDGIALYNASHANTSTNALSISGVDITAQAMAAQTGFGQSQEILGDRNLLRYLILPPELGALGERILNPSDQYLATVSNAGTDTTLDPAMFKGQGKRALTYHDLTDATDWYAVADPNMVETIVMGFLNGRQEPEFFTQDQPEVGSVFTADKISYKTRFIFGGTIADYRSFYRNVVGG